jgi:hypothetical protein
MRETAGVWDFLPQYFYVSLGNFWGDLHNAFSDLGIFYKSLAFLGFGSIRYSGTKLEFWRNKKRSFDIGPAKATASVGRTVFSIRIRNSIKIMQIHMRFLPQVLHNTVQMLKNQNFFSFCHSMFSFQCFIFLVSVKGVIIFSIIDSISKISGKK